MIDCHLHTSFSPDSVQDIRRLVEHAADKGFTYIALTDHAENGTHPTVSAVNYDVYFREIARVRKKFPNITIAAGAEFGYGANACALNKELIDQYPFDYVINSVHHVMRRVYALPKQLAYNAYFDTVMQSLAAPYYFTAVGHFGYIARYAPYGDPILHLAEHRDIIDRILETIIRRDIVLEINSSVGGSGGFSVPDRDILERYYALGGRLVTFASDAHEMSRLGDRYAQITEAARSIGFDGWTAAVERKLVKFPF